MRSRELLFVASLLVATCAGCSSSAPDIAAVEGTVLMDGKPLPDAAVVFIPENGRPAGARTDEGGHYVLNYTEGRQGAIPGKCKVLVTTQRDPGPDKNGIPRPGSRETVPAKYNVNSELTFVVEEGKQNVADFELESKGRVQQWLE